MDDMNAFDQQLASVVLRRVGPSRPVDDAAIFTAITATPSPKWRFQSMFSATKFLVAGAIVALFGGFLLSGVTTQQPSEDRPPAVGASAPSTTQAGPTDAATSEPEPTTGADGTTTTSDLLPGVELVAEEIKQGVYRVLSDGVRDVRGRGMAVSADGDVWLLRGSIGDWSVVRLGEPGVSLHLTDGKNRRVSLRLDPNGAPVVSSYRVPGGESRIQVFDGTEWVRTDPEDAACPDEVGIVMPDGACWQLGPSRFEGDRWIAVPKAELGLADDQWIDQMTVGPDGTGWLSVVTVDPETELPSFDGLLRYDGDIWTSVPYAPSADLTRRVGTTWEMAVAPDGTIWMTEFPVSEGEKVTVRSWDGVTWSSYTPSEQPDYRDWCSPYGCSTPGGIHLNSDGTAWVMGGTLFFDGESLGPVDPELIPRQTRYFAPNGEIWVLVDRRLQVITPEAVVGAE